MKCSKCNGGMLRCVSGRVSKRSGCYIRVRKCDNKKCNYKVFTVELDRKAFERDLRMIEKLQEMLAEYHIATPL